MRLAFYFDHNFEADVARGLRLRGIDVLTCTMDGTAEWDDRRILQRATELSRPIVTHDRDFIDIATEYLESGQFFAGIIYSHPQSLSIGKLISDLQMIAGAMTLDELECRVYRLPI